MKKYWIPAVSLALVTASVGTLAHMPAAQPDGAHPGPGHAAMHSPEMRAWQAEMHSKMAAAQTPEERQALMQERQEKMREKMPGVAGMPGMGHMGNMEHKGNMGHMGNMGRMGSMPMRHQHPMMQEQRPSSGS